MSFDNNCSTIKTTLVRRRRRRRRGRAVSLAFWVGCDENFFTQRKFNSNFPVINS